MRRTITGLSVVAALALAVPLTRCGGPSHVTPPKPPENRCEIDLSAFTSDVGKSARARKIEAAEDLIPGDAAQGRLGDFRLENDRIRLVVQAPDRHVQPNPYGGALVDASLAKDGARDSFGKLALLHSFGRTQRATNVSVLQSGEYGGAAVVVSDGVDALNNFLNLKTQVGGYAPGKSLVIDPDAALPLTLSTYYVLNPGESRVRVVTAFCNDGEAGLDLPVGDLVDSGGSVEFFQPGACTGGMGSGSSLACQVSDMSWFGFQGGAVAYGYAPYRPGSSTEPSLHNARLAMAGVVASLLGATQNRSPMDALLDWTDPNIKQHDGTLHVEAGGKGILVRDVVVGRDLGEVASLIATYRNAELRLPMGDLKGTVKAGGQPVAGARVALEQDVDGQRLEQAVFVTDSDGAWSGHLVAGEYLASAWAPGSPNTDAVKLAIQAAGAATHDFELTAPRRLTVQVRDLAGDPMPGKVTVLCEGGACPVPSSRLGRYTDVVRDPWPDSVAAIDFAGPSGTVELLLPPAQYRVVVSRGPAWTIFPTTWKPDAVDVSTGHAVDLTAADAAVTATLAKVLDASGWLAADLNVHAVNSTDSYVSNTDRLLSFMAEGVDVLVATDHDFVTDLAPANEELGGGKFLATVPGEEISTFDYGHTNAWPLVRDEADLTGGAIDWAGGAEGTCLSQPELNAAARKRGAGTVQLNHPRGPLGVFTASRLDTDTGATHADPTINRIASGSELMSFDFDAMEILNGNLSDFGGEPARELFNDWFTFLSRGVLVAGTGVSDTHGRFLPAAGYWRSYVRTGATGITGFDAAKLSEAVNKLQVVATNGPFVKLSARTVDGAGAPTGSEVEVGGTLATSGKGFELVVDAQAPTWMSLGKIEIYGHIAGGDVSCAQSTDPKVNPKSRVACNGEGNRNWPPEGIAASAAIAASDLALEKVGEKDGITYQRARVTKRFAFPAPAGDTWYVAAAYGAGSMFPVVYAAVDAASGRAVDAAPFAFTNPVFIDADGSGYDKPPAGKMGGGR
ncbi:MAG TPA: CehA/McbA family metallohydrolase [Myxococcales bacterium]|jgi:hypothetical protein